MINVLNDRGRAGAERSFAGKLHKDGSTELNLMPLLGPGRAYFSVQVIEKGDRTARMHSHSALDEYYLILEGKGTLRYNGRAIEFEKGDLIGKPTGPDAATHLIADRGEKLRILDMEVWNERFTGTSTTAKDVMFWPDHDELQMRGPGWAAVVPKDSLLSTKDLEQHFNDDYRRTKDGLRATPKTPSGRRPRSSRSDEAAA